MPEVHEEVVNVRLAEILSRDFGIDCRAERVRGRRRPDIRCYYKGFIVGIEASYNKSDAERDAESRVREDLAHIALALWIKQRFRDVPEPELENLIRASKFDVKIFVPVEARGLLRYLAEVVKKEVKPATGWFEDMDLPAVAEIIESSLSFMFREEEVQELIEEMKSKVNDFIDILEDLDRKGVVRERLYNILYKLYGLSTAEAQDPSVAFGHAALSILLSTVFYEHIRSNHPELRPIDEYVRSYGPITGLRRALEDLLKVDYRVAVELAIEVLNVMPPDAMYAVKSLIDLGMRIVASRGLLKRDFAGRVYHEITGDIALRKGFATFYTEVPAAYLLATLATLSLLGLDEERVLTLDQGKARELISKITSTKIGDLACGSGTLLTASYNALRHISKMLKFYYNLEDVDLDAIGKTLIENGIYGVDALRYASQITAINLALTGPSIIERENVFTIYLGYIPERKEGEEGKGQAWLGSLELLNNVSKVGGLLAYIEGGLRGIAERTTLEGLEGVFTIPHRFNMIIMNPPFTRPTYRGERAPEEKRAFFGFIADERVREQLREKYLEVLDKVTDDLRKIARASVNNELRDVPDEIKDIITGRADAKLKQYLNIGLAGEALPFLYLAYRYVDDDGVIAFVLPRAVLSGISWFLARVLLASKFHVKYVIVSSDPKNGSNFSEGTSLSEALIVAKRVGRHDPSEETTFIILTKKPSTALEGVLVANSIVEARRKRLPRFSHGDVDFIVKIVSRRDLLKHIDNWHRFVAIPDNILANYVFRLMEGVITIGKHDIKIPMVKLGNILKTVYVEKRRGKERVKEATKGIGIDAAQFYSLYSRVNNYSPYPALIGTEEKLRMTMMVEPNAYIEPKSEDVRDKAIDTFRAFAGRILVPGVNVWWETSRVIALYSRRELLSNTHYALKLNVDPSVEPYAEKALVLWFNTTWGLLTILLNREETRGPWAQVKMGQWMLMPVLDVTSLDRGKLEKLATVFDLYAERPPRRIPKQFNPDNPDPVRLGIDRDFIKALDPTLEDEIVERGLKEFYKHVDVVLKLWIG
jgi:hypothetical protein